MNTIVFVHNYSSCTFGFQQRTVGYSESLIILTLAPLEEVLYKSLNESLNITKGFVVENQQRVIEDCYKNNA